MAPRALLPYAITGMPGYLMPKTEILLWMAGTPGAFYQGISYNIARQVTLYSSTRTIQ